jgi:hypothetical protein
MRYGVNRAAICLIICDVLAMIDVRETTHALHSVRCIQTPDDCRR